MIGNILESILLYNDCPNLVINRLRATLYFFSARHNNITHNFALDTISQLFDQEVYHFIEEVFVDNRSVLTQFPVYTETPADKCLMDVMNACRLAALHNMPNQYLWKEHT